MPKQINEQTSYMRAIGFDLRQSYDSEGRVQYVGIAYPKAKDSEIKWQIYKLKYDSSSRLTHRAYANGTDAFTLEWDERVNYSYPNL